MESLTADMRATTINTDVIRRDVQFRSHLEMTRARFIADHLPSLWKNPHIQTHLKMNDPFFTRCEETFASVTKHLQLVRQCFENMRDLACGDLRLPVILLECPRDSQRKSYDEMVAGTKTLVHIKDILLGLGLDLKDVVVIDTFPLLEKVRLEELGLQPEVKEEVITKVFGITADFLRTFNPPILISCQCATSRDGVYSFFNNELARYLGSSKARAKNDVVKLISFQGPPIHIVQAFHPAHIYRGDKDEQVKRKELWLKILCDIVKPCKEHFFKKVVASVKSASPSVGNLAKNLAVQATLNQSASISDEDSEKNEEPEEVQDQSLPVDASAETAPQEQGQASPTADLSHFAERLQSLSLMRERELLRHDMNELVRLLEPLKAFLSRRDSNGPHLSGHHEPERPNHRPLGSDQSISYDSNVGLTRPPAQESEGSNSSSLFVSLLSSPPSQGHEIFEIPSRPLGRSEPRSRSEGPGPNHRPDYGYQEQNNNLFGQSDKDITHPYNHKQHNPAHAFLGNSHKRELSRPRSAAATSDRSTSAATPSKTPQDPTDLLSPASLTSSASSRDAWSPPTSMRLQTSDGNTLNAGVTPAKVKATDEATRLRSLSSPRYQSSSSSRAISPQTSVAHERLSEPCQNRRPNKFLFPSPSSPRISESKDNSEAMFESGQIHSALDRNSSAPSAANVSAEDLAEPVLINSLKGAESVGSPVLELDPYKTMPGAFPQDEDDEDDFSPDLAPIDRPSPSKHLSDRAADNRHHLSSFSFGISSESGARLACPPSITLTVDKNQDLSLVDKTNDPQVSIHISLSTSYIRDLLNSHFKDDQVSARHRATSDPLSLPSAESSVDAVQAQA